MASAQGIPQIEQTLSLASLPNINAEDVRRTFGSLEFSKAGDSLAQKGSWKEARSHYQDALNLWKDSPDANYGLARCCRALGDTAGEIVFYRAAIYSTNPADKGFRETQTNRLMEFALLLSQSGQAQESLAVYHKAAAEIDYVEGKQKIDVLLPAFGDSEGQVPYSTQALQAMAHVGIAVYSQDDKEKRAHLEAAIKLQPDMPQAYYYKGQALWGEPGRSREALAAYQTARHFAGVDTQLLIDHVIEKNGLEKAAASEQAHDKKTGLF